MLPDEVRKAVEDIEFRLRGVWEPQADVHADFAAIKAHLLTREAEVERLLGGTTEAFVCSNPQCGVVHAVDPCGHCPACIQDSGAGWSTSRRRYYARVQKMRPSAEWYRNKIINSPDEPPLIAASPEVRAERAEALLREVADCAQSAIKAGDWKVDGACDLGSAFNRITAHLSENSRG